MREQLLDMLEKETELLTSHSSSEESSSMIETAAYIFLVHVSKPDLAYNDASVTKLVHWLSGQRNAFGGFASAQDTVVSLQALAQYAALIPQEIRDVKSQGCTQCRRLAAAVSMYSYTGSREISNMALVEVEMLSGFIPVSSSVTALEKISLVKKTEIKPDKVTIYLEKLGKTSLKLNISVEQDVEVQNLNAATVHVYDYYKPDDRTAREYVFPCSSDVSKKSSYWNALALESIT
ncbi:hypothetical protein AV530_012333 [Patagioenas fasciata monilis]|uniref:Alpha-macroglobulin receptor-binding domain-containing protein n=1 Tax=Patagioenas fasciata monilis TaxID=372326 RepID=A0A1V4JAN1_PATFA|nr:hypothetical protein AV530_012333 [Patagioenas fasciata monilis]